MVGFVKSNEVVFFFYRFLWFLLVLVLDFCLVLYCWGVWMIGWCVRGFWCCEIIMFLVYVSYCVVLCLSFLFLLFEFVLYFWFLFWGFLFFLWWSCCFWFWSILILVMIWGLGVWDIKWLGILLFSFVILSWCFVLDDMYNVFWWFWVFVIYFLGYIIDEMVGMLFF